MRQMQHRDCATGQSQHDRETQESSPITLTGRGRGCVTICATTNNRRRTTLMALVVAGKLISKNSAVHRFILHVLQSCLAHRQARCACPACRCTVWKIFAGPYVFDWNGEPKRLAFHRNGTAIRSLRTPRIKRPLEIRPARSAHQRWQAPAADLPAYLLQLTPAAAARCLHHRGGCRKPP